MHAMQGTTDRCQGFRHLPGFSTGAELAVLSLSGTVVGRIAAMVLTPLCSHRDIVDAALEMATKMSQGTSILVTLVSTCMEIGKSDLGYVPFVSSAVFDRPRISPALRFAYLSATPSLDQGVVYTPQLSDWEGLRGDYADQLPRTGCTPPLAFPTVISITSIRLFRTSRKMDSLGGT